MTSTSSKAQNVMSVSSIELGDISSIDEVLKSLNDESSDFTDENNNSDIEYACIKKKKDKIKSASAKLKTKKILKNRPNNSPIRYAKTNQESWKSFENYHLTNIDSICSHLEDINTIKEKKKTLSQSNPNLNGLKDTHIYFFNRISEILNSFISLNNYLIFKNNNNLIQKSVDNYPILKDYEEFLAKSRPLTKWLNNLDPVNKSDGDNIYTLHNKQNEEFNNSSFLIAENEENRIENKLKDIKDQFDASLLLNKLERETNSVTEIEQDNQRNMDHVFLKGTSNLIAKVEHYENVLTVGAEMTKYDEIIKLLSRELVSAQHKVRVYEKKLNSEKYKTISREYYNNLKIQIKLYRQDFKLESQEKSRFQQQCLIYKFNQNKLDSSIINEREHMIDF